MDGWMMSKELELPPKHLLALSFLWFCFLIQAVISWFFCSCLY